MQLSAFLSHSGSRSDVGQERYGKNLSDSTFASWKSKRIVPYHHFASSSLHFYSRESRSALHLTCASQTGGDVILKANEPFSRAQSRWSPRWLLSTEFVSVWVSALGWMLMWMWLKVFRVSPDDQPESPEPLQWEGFTCQPASSGQTAARWSHLQVRVHLSSCIFPHVYKSLVRLRHFMSLNCRVRGMFGTAALFEVSAIAEM